MDKCKLISVFDTLKMHSLETKLYSKSTQVIAAWGALLYFSISAAYLWLSTFLAAHFAESLSSFRSTELAKGTLFMLVNATIFGLIFWLIVEKLRKRRLKIAQLEEQIVLLDRRAMVGTFTSAAAHDIHNMISGLEGWIGVIKENSPMNESNSEAFSLVEKSIDGLSKITERLTNVGQEDVNKRLELVDPFLVINRTLDLLAKHDRLANRKVQRQIAEKSQKILLDLGLFQQMFINLVLNAADATGPGGLIRVTCSFLDGKLVLEIHDNGPGIPSESRKNIFDAYKSTKSRGRGLGLLSVKECIQSHKGNLEIADSDLGGALFRVTIHSK